MFIHVYILIILMFFNINFQYIKIHNTYTTILPRIVYFLTIWLFYIMSTAYKSG
jgi:hypothetical protein